MIEFWPDQEKWDDPDLIPVFRPVFVPRRLEELKKEEILLLFWELGIKHPDSVEQMLMLVDLSVEELRNMLYDQVFFVAQRNIRKALGIPEPKPFRG